MSELKDTIVGLLLKIAPEADAAEIKPNVDLRDQLDIDSMDHLNFVIAMAKQFGNDAGAAVGAICDLLGRSGRHDQ